MDWIPLRKYNVHLVDLQVDRVIALCSQLHESILQGDILSIQRLSQLELSIKRRVQAMDQFYNQNGLDQRVRFLQVPRMKLSKILNLNFIRQKSKQYQINLPWNQNKGSEVFKNTNRTPVKKSITPPKKEIPKQENLRQQVSKSPIAKPKQQKKPEEVFTSRKPNITLQIPTESPYDNYTFNDDRERKEHKHEQKKVKTGRKTQLIPERTPITKLKNLENNSNVTPSKNEHTPAQKNIAVSRVQPSVLTSSRGKPTIGSNKSLAESSNVRSMKKLNDLIFTIKMTKEEYDDFMDIKRNLQQTK